MADVLNIISFTAFGAVMVDRIREAISDDMIVTVDSGREIKLSLWTETHFKTGHVLLFIGAAGIAVRAIAPYVTDKTKDPAVIVMDEEGRFAVPILSGHIGGANAYAVRFAEAVGGTAVLTTATDVNGLLAVDTMARREGLAIASMKAAKAFAAAILDEKKARILIPQSFENEIKVTGLTPELTCAVFDDRFDKDRFETDCFEPDCFETDRFRENDAVLSPCADELMSDRGGVHLIPKCLILGVGCRRGKSGENLIAFVIKEMKAKGLSLRAVRKIVSIDLKQDEAGLHELAAYLKVPFETYGAEVLKAVPGDFGHSDFVAKTTGVDNVCERAAAAAGAVRFCLHKTACEGMTLAIGAAETVIHIGETI